MPKGHKQIQIIVESIHEKVNPYGHENVINVFLCLSDICWQRDVSVAGWILEFRSEHENLLLWL